MCLACRGTDWSNFQNIKIADGQYAATELEPDSQCFQSSCYYSRGLLAENFGFTIPSNALIMGIKAEVLKSANIDSLSDYEVTLLQYGDPVGMNKAKPEFWPLSSLGYTLYGDSSDTWGVNWTPLQIDSSTFGLCFAVQNNKRVQDSDIAYVDHIRMTVFYKTPEGITEHQSSDDNYSVYYDCAGQAIVINRGEYASPVSEINIYNALGQKVFAKNRKNCTVMPTEKISILNLHEGIYLVELTGNGRSDCRKILITR